MTYVWIPGALLAVPLPPTYALPDTLDPTLMVTPDWAVPNWRTEIKLRPRYGLARTVLSLP